MTDIPNKPEIKDDPSLDKVEFETEADRLRMDADEAKKKAAFERVPRSGSGADLEHHRRTTGQRRRFLENVGQHSGWKDLPKGLIETVKTILKANEEPAGQPPFKAPPGKHPLVATSLDKNNKKKEEPKNG